MFEGNRSIGKVDAVRIEEVIGFRVFTGVKIIQKLFSFACVDHFRSVRSPESN